jgi:hypothetical protein
MRAKPPVPIFPFVTKGRCCVALRAALLGTLCFLHISSCSGPADYPFPKDLERIDRARLGPAIAKLKPEDSELLLVYMQRTVLGLVSDDKAPTTLGDAVEKQRQLLASGVGPTNGACVVTMPHLEHELPRLKAELDTDPAYRELLSGALPEHTDALLSGLAEVLRRKGGFSHATYNALNEGQSRHLMYSLRKLFVIYCRTCEFPVSFARLLDNRLQATKNSPHRGLWGDQPRAGVPHDYTLLAVLRNKKDPSYLRELIAARDDGQDGIYGWQQFVSEYPIPYLASEFQALRALAQLSPLSQPERERLEFERLPRVGSNTDVNGVRYQLANAHTTKRIGDNQFTRFTARRGAQLIVLRYTVVNLTNETQTVAGRVRLVDREGRVFSPASRGTLATLRSGSLDSMLTQLQPGLPQDHTVVFEVPTDVTAPFRFRIEDGRFPTF